jgi:uncharacterized protein YqgC (DUF456 family)
MDNRTALVIMVATAMAVGVAGTVVPFVPGLGLVWLAAVGYGLAAGFDVAGWVAFLTITALAVAGLAAGVVLPHRAARGSGATSLSLTLGAATAVVGFFVVPVIGLPLGGVLGIFIGELLRTRDATVAWRATSATLKGFGLGTLVQVVFGLAMVSVWLLWVVMA